MHSYGVGIGTGNSVLREGSVSEDLGSMSMAVRIQDPSLVLKKDVERFLWNFLALRTSSGSAVGADGEICYAQVSCCF